jgi:hypothetical protein
MIHRLLPIRLLGGDSQNTASRRWQSGIPSSQGLAIAMLLLVPHPPSLHEVSNLGFEFGHLVWS